MGLVFLTDPEHDLIMWFIHDVSKTEEFYRGMKTAVECGQRHAYTAEIVYFDDNACFDRNYYTSIDRLRETLREYSPFMPKRTVFRCLPHHQTDIPQLLAFLGETDKDILQDVSMFSDLEEISRELNVPLEVLEGLLEKATRQSMARRSKQVAASA